MTANLLAPSVFESFNARALAPQQVAESFVPSSQYQELTRRAHTLVVGPRGSGKTTLMKMLQQPALEAWMHDEAAKYRKRIDFTGVFIPSDVSWSEQVEALGHDKLRREHRVLLGKAAFTTHVLRALIVAMEHRVHAPSVPKRISHRRLTLADRNEAQMVKALQTAWHIRPALPRLLSLKSELRVRLSEIASIASREATLGENGRSQRLGEIAFLHLHFLEASAVAIDLFEDAIGGDTGKWALLFDELELAPDWIHDELIRSLRSFDERFLFKLALSPFTKDVAELKSALSAMPGHDYATIPLWYARKEDGYAFCQALLKGMLHARGLEDRDAASLFGQSEFETSKEEWASSGTAYRAGSRHARRFARMAKNDYSFKEYLREKGIVPGDLASLSGNRRAAVLRKVAPLVAVRDAFRTSDTMRGQGKERLRRSRKNPKLYAGAKSLFAIAEGNPRWFIGIVDQLLSGITPEARTIDAAKQSREISRASQRFRALLRTIPCPPIHKNQPPRGVLSILDRVGDFLFDSVVLADFNADPPGSFKVDSRADQSLIESLGRALNAGAIVYVPDSNAHVLLSTLRGKRFRLSYLLAPHYEIPIRLGRSAPLRAILERIHRAKEEQNGEQLLWGEQNE